MSLSYTTKVTLTGSVGKQCLIRSAANDVLVLSDAKYQRFDLSLHTQIGSTLTMPFTGEAIALCTTSCALVGFSSSATVTLIEISTGYQQNYTGGASVAASDRANQSAGDPVNNIVLSSNGSAGTLGKFNGNTFVSSTITNSTIPFVAQIIIFKGSGRWLIGCNSSSTIGGGVIYEIDASFNIYKVLVVDPAFSWKFAGVTPTAQGLYNTTICGLNLFNDILTVITTQGGVYQYSYSSGDLLYKQVGAGTIFTTPTGIQMSQCPFGVSLIQQQGNGNYTAFMETFSNKIPYTSGDVISLNLTARSSSVDIHPTSGICTSTDVAGNLYFFNMSVPSQTNESVSLSDPSGTPVKGEVIMWNETDQNMILHTTVPAGGSTISLPQGKTVMQIGKIYSGTDGKWDIAEIST